MLSRKIENFYSRLIYAAIILIPFVASFSSAAVNIFVGLTIFAFIAKKISKKEFSVINTPINLPFLMLIAISLLSFVNSVSMRSSLQGITKLMKYGFLFIIVAEQLKDRGHLKKVIVALALGLYMASLDSVYQLYFGKDLFRNKPYDLMLGLTRPTSSFPHTNVFAAYLALFLPLLIALALYYLKGKKRILLSLISALILYCLIFTLSRSAIMGVWSAVFFMGLIKKDKLIIALLILSVILAPFFIPKNLSDWAKKADSLWELLLNKERITIFKTSLNMVRAHPFVGVGVNTFILNYKEYKAQETSGFTGEGRYFAHNSYLNMAGEIGLSGLIIFLILLFTLFKQFFKFNKKAHSEFLKICALGLIACVISFLINGLTETNLYYSKIAVLFWYQVGLLLGIFRLNQGQVADLR